MIPAFDENGNLPEGVHSATWQEFAERFGWTIHRRRQLKGLENALAVLRTAGCQKAYIDGSFVTAKEIPNDYDACWDMDGVDPLLLDPVFLQFENGRASQKVKYLGEFFPAQGTELRSGRVFLDFFQIDKDIGQPKGIIFFDLENF